MVKMAHAPLPKLMCKPLNTSSMCPTDFATSTALSDVLKSDPVKRLLNQPNIIIRTVPLQKHDTSSSVKNFFTNRHSSRHRSSRPERPEISIVPLQMETEESKEEENLLPSKKEGKSEIILVPIKREQKPCGHYEPCENIVCDVAVQQYVDRDRASPMLATSIEEDEINAPVSKHCKNEMCDALSIDHNRCRRAVIRLNRYNRSSACDICGVMLKTLRARLHHKNCTRKNEYRHNEAGSAEILKERMREREIQILENSKVKKNDYMNPVTGYSLAMETLQNNEELIVIPKSVPRQRSAANAAPAAIAEPSPQVNANNVFRNIFSNIPIVLPQQSIVIGKTPCSNENSVTAPMQVALPDTLNRLLMATTSAVPLPQNQYVTFSTPQNPQQITLNDLLFSQSQFMTTPIQPKPMLTPIRVVPITNLITQPSLLHQTQGIPKFCIMADTTAPVPVPVGITTPQPIQPSVPSVPVPKVSIPQNREILPRLNLEARVLKRRKTPIRKKGRIKRKDFKCNYCQKGFSTDWYFKIHVAKHTGGKQFPCKVCALSFTKRCDLKRHIKREHTGERSPRKVKKEQATEQSQKCSDCSAEYATADELKHHKQKCHGITECRLCHDEVLLEEMDRHMMSVHEPTKNVKVKEESIELDDTREEVSKIGVLSNIIETKINNYDLQQENNDSRMNGYVSIPDQISVEGIKTELSYEV